IAAHIDGLRMRLPSAERNCPGNHSCRSGIDREISGLCAFLRGFLFGLAARTGASGQYERNERKPEHPSHSAPPVCSGAGGGPASLGNSPVSDSRNCTRSSRSCPDKFSGLIFLSRYGFELPPPA